MNILEVNHVAKNFAEQSVLKDVDFVVPAHTIFGFLGENGAGKTTTMKIILGLLKSTSGNVQVSGERVHYGETKTNQKIGYLPDVPAFYEYMTAVEYLHFCGDLTGMGKRERQEKIDELLVLVDLKKNKKRISGFSRGMKQRLGIAQALLNEPTLLICDEPTSALDPIGRQDMMNLLEKVKEKTTVLFSTHILSDAEKICDEVAILHEGKIVLQGKLADIKAQQEKQLEIRFMSATDCQKFLKNSDFKDSQQVDAQTLTIPTVDYQKTAAESFAILTNYRLVPQKFEMSAPSLEDIFMEVVR